MSPQPEQTPSIRIVPHVEGPRSLQFDIIEREVPDGTSIKIGRFTDKANLPNRVTFKSKVVSRGHAEIWSENGKFYIKDTKSSSGTFLNRSRLSAPGQESKPYPLKDGDIVQLGVDYQGGTEEIYRCVKMRIELNRSWQHKVNEFSINAMKQLKALTGPDAFKHQTQDCCICLCGIGPCQALFLAPCSHVFHYKCIRPLLSNHPAFLCPLCRSYANLDATIDNSVDWEQVLAEHDEDAKKSSESKDEDNQKSEGKEKIDVTESTHSGSSSGILSFDSITINGKRLSELTGPERTELFKILQNPDTSSQKLISATKNSSYSATESSSTSALITHPISSASHSTSTSTTQAVPIPFRRQNASYVPDEDSNLLSRTLPSSPMQSVLSYYEDDCGPSATAPALRDQQSSPRLDEIAEEDEDGIHSFSFRGGNVRSEGSGSASGQDAGSSSDAMSDDGEELEAEPKFRIVSCQLIKGDEDIVLVSGERGEKERNSMSREKNRDKNERRVKGKGVDRVIGRRKEGENFL